MRIARLATVGFLLQTMFLAAFALVARMPYSGFFKMAVVTMAALSIGGLLLYATRVLSFGRTIWFCLGLAVGYVIGFHILGVIYFGGLLKDFDLNSIDYLQSIVSVIFVLFLLYAVGATCIFLVRAFLSKKNGK